MAKAKSKKNSYKKKSNKRYSKKNVDQHNNHVRGWVTARVSSIVRADEITC